MIDFRDVKLQNQAAYEAMQLGHKLLEWHEDAARDGVYQACCKFCQHSVWVGNRLREPMSGELLEEPCTVNTGYDDRVIPFHDGTGCSQVIRYDHDRGRVSVRGCV